MAGASFQQVFNIFGFDFDIVQLGFSWVFTILEKNVENFAAMAKEQGSERGGNGVPAELGGCDYTYDTHQVSIRNFLSMTAPGYLRGI